MLTGIEKSNLRTLLAGYEGNIKHMYLDSKGYLTIGVGHRITNLQAAQKLNLVVAGGGSAGARATKEQIKTDYEAVYKQLKGNDAFYYGKYTKLMLTVTEVNKLTNKHIGSSYKELKRLYADFDNYPNGVRLALFDMIFNLGMPGLKDIFLKFCKAVKAKKWAEAAKESHRPDVNDPRNNYVKALFEAAAKDAAMATTLNKNVSAAQNVAP